MKKIFLTAGLLAGMFASAVSYAQTQAKSCYDFVESIGVCTHFDYNNTAYVQNFNAVKAKLGALGVRYIRDRAPIAALELSRNRAWTVYKEFGIKTLTIFGEKYYTNAEIDTRLNWQVGRTDMIMAFEGPNEPDARKTGANTPCCWTDDLRANQLYLYKAVKNHPDAGIKSKLVVAPSPTYPSGITWMGDMSDRADLYNIHSYHGGRQPEYAESNLANYLVEIPKVYTDSQALQKIWATEAGYNNHEPSNGISEEGEATYINRMFLYYFKKGIQRTFNYELIDPTPNEAKNFGLLRNDVTEKPAYKAIKNLIAVLRDTTNFTPGSLTYSLSKTDGIEQVLLQKSNGKFYLCLWQNASVYDITTDVAISNSPMVVTINASIASAKVYEPKSGTSVTNTFGTASSFTIQVPDHPVIIEITPANGSVLTASGEDTSKAGNGETVVYPNPNSRGIFNLTTLTPGTRITVTNLMGRVVISERKWNSETLDLSNEPDGVYLLRTSTGETVKLIKK